jgi:D-cysteine desulfhydrase family pyridoxal phosphate-dependent enzyme
MNYILDKIPVAKLANLPTPLEETSRLAKKIGLAKLFIKRDDLTGLAGGGNKARKLEYEFAEILNGDYDVILTAGGIQSNHARMTAAAGRKLGFDVKLVLGGPDFKDLRGNLFLDMLFGAEIRYLVDDDSNDNLTMVMEKWADELRLNGKKPFIIPIGGGSLGSLGYVKAMEELSSQFGNENVQIVVAVGSCGTLAGCILGSKLFMTNAKVTGISISRTSEAIKIRTEQIIDECAKIINHEIDPNDLLIECYDNYFLEYGEITEAGKQAIFDCADLEGIILDPIYTGKAMAGLADLVAKNILDKNIPVIFIHTGGLPILFSFEKELGRAINLTKINKAV